MQSEVRHVFDMGSPVIVGFTDKEAWKRKKKKSNKTRSFPFLCTPYRAGEFMVSKVMMCGCDHSNVKVKQWFPLGRDTIIISSFFYILINLFIYNMKRLYTWWLQLLKLRIWARTVKLIWSKYIHNLYYILDKHCHIFCHLTEKSHTFLLTSQEPMKARWQQWMHCKG